MKETSGAHPKPSTGPITPQELITEESTTEDKYTDLVSLRETPEEIDQFKKYVKMFRLKNPRQIRRLRNSYRLLKVMEEGRQGISLMFIIFLMEFLMEKDSKTTISETQVNFDSDIFDDIKLNEAVNEEIITLGIDDLDALAATGLQVILPSAHEKQLEIKPSS